MPHVRAREDFRAVHNFLVLSFSAGEDITGEIADYLLSTGAPVDAVVEAEVRRPAVNAPKSEWVGYAVSQGFDRDEAEALTKADLVQLD